jgi:hypothetical protein
MAWKQYQRWKPNWKNDGGWKNDDCSQSMNWKRENWWNQSEGQWGSKNNVKGEWEWKNESKKPPDSGIVAEKHVAAKETRKEQVERKEAAQMIAAMKKSYEYVKKTKRPSWMVKQPPRGINHKQPPYRPMKSRRRERKHVHTATEDKWPT